MYHQLTSEQRSQIFVLLQKKTSRKEMAALTGTSESTLSRELHRNSTALGHYLWKAAQTKAMERRRRVTANRAKDPDIVWEALTYLKDMQWSPKQISGYMALRGKRISHELIYRHIRADASGTLQSNCRHKLKYNRHGRRDRTTKVRNIPFRTSIHMRPPEADGTRFGDWEMDTIIGKNGKGAILTLTERSTNFAIIEKLPSGKDPLALARVAARLLFPYRGKGRAHDNHGQRKRVLRTPAHLKSPERHQGLFRRFLLFLAERLHREHEQVNQTIYSQRH
jgi:IS30 family transposase